MVIKRNASRLGSLLFLSITCFGFQNWNYIDLKEATIGPVNDHSRLAHAKELLGKSYHGKNALQLENITDLNQQILDQMTDRLPKNYKKSALKVTQALIEESEKNNLDPVFVMAVIETESKFNPLAHGQHGEIGMMQIKPDTAAWISKKSMVRFKNAKTLENPAQNIRLGVAYIAFLRNSFRASAAKYVTAYNMGPKKLRNMISENQKPKEYATRVMSNYKSLYSEIKYNSDKTRLNASVDNELYN